MTSQKIILLCLAQCCFKLGVHACWYWQLVSIKTTARAKKSTWCIQYIRHFVDDCYNLNTFRAIISISDNIHSQCMKLIGLMKSISRGKKQVKWMKAIHFLGRILSRIQTWPTMMINAVRQNCWPTIVGIFYRQQRPLKCEIFSIHSIIWSIGRVNTEYSKWNRLLRSLTYKTIMPASRFP